MKVVCKNANFEAPGKILTIGKIYDVISTSDHEQYLIKDDSGGQRWYNTSRFEELSTIRQEKLKQLGI
jgi:hypothetical protein